MCTSGVAGMLYIAIHRCVHQKYIAHVIIDTSDPTVGHYRIALWCSAREETLGPLFILVLTSNLLVTL